MIVEIAHQAREYGPRIAWRNFRFQLGYRIGGFTRAWNYTEEELANGEAQNAIDDLMPYVRHNAELFDQDALPDGVLTVDTSRTVTYPK